MEKIIMDDIPKLNFRVEEAYKTLRTNIQFCGENIKAISCGYAAVKDNGRTWEKDTND